MGYKTTPINLRGDLRQMTADVHANLETRWFGTGGFTSRSHYEEFLRQAFGVHRDLGLPAAQVWGDEDAVTGERARIAHLASDLGAKPDHRGDRRTMTESYAWGVAYVLNGSCLGASVMLKRGDIPDDWPSRYFAHGRTYVQNGGLKRFFEKLNAAPIDPGAASQGANACFEAFMSTANHTH